MTDRIVYTKLSPTKVFEDNPYKLSDIAGLPLLSSTQDLINDKPFYNLIERIFDFVFSILGIIVISPFCIVVSIAIKLNDKGPVFFKQTRIGLNGTFSNFKI